MLRLKLQYFGYLMRRANSLEKILMLAEIEGRNRRGQQSMRCLDDITRDFLGGLDSKESICNARDPNSISGSGRSTGKGNSHPLQYCCLEHPMDRGTWRAVGHDWATNIFTFTFHRLNGHEFEQTPRDSEGPRSLVCGSPWYHKDLHRTEWLNNK